MQVTLENLDNFAAGLVDSLKGGDIIALSGPLAAGKTTFTQSLVRALGYKGRISSPTFVLERRYPIDHSSIKEVVHLDFYRLNYDQITSFDWSESAGDPDILTIVEWPERVGKLLPPGSKLIKVEKVDEKTRNFQIPDNFGD